MVDTIGLQRPDNNVTSNDVSSHRAEVQSAIDNFSNHQGNIIGNQIAEQGKSVYHVGRDGVNALVDKVKEGFKDQKSSLDK
jgi:hypothetical protein